MPQHDRIIELDGCIVCKCSPSLLAQHGKSFQAILRQDWETWIRENPRALWMPAEYKAYGDTPEEAVEAIKAKRGKE